MRAISCVEFGGPEKLVLENLPSPEPGSNEVVVKVHAAAVNFPDSLIIQNKYQFKPPLPFSPGAEAAGVVTKIGSNTKRLKVGDRVINVSPFGAFREEIVCNENTCIPISNDMDFQTGAAFMMAYGTSHYALSRRANIKPGDKLLVLGAAGGVGLAAVELGVAMGAHVIAAASTQDKLDLCKEAGAHDTILYAGNIADKDAQRAFSQQIKSATNGNGADVVYDPVGGAYSEPALRAMNWNGRYLVIGFASGDIPTIPLNLTLLKGTSVVGVFWGAHTLCEPKEHLECIAELMKFYQEGKIKPKIASIYVLEDTPKAIQEISERRAKGKIIISMV